MNNLERAVTLRKKLTKGDWASWLDEPLAAEFDAIRRETQLEEAKAIQQEVDWAVQVKTKSRAGAVSKWLAERIAELEARSLAPAGPAEKEKPLP